MTGIKLYIVYGIVVLVALGLGRWYAKERDSLMAKGKPWTDSLKTPPGILIILILGALILYRVFKG